MKKLTFALTMMLGIFLFTGCSDDDTPVVEPVGGNTTTKTVTNLHAPRLGGQGQPVTGPFTKFSFSTGAITESDTEWDIAIRGQVILVNGGEKGGIAEEPERNGNAAAYIATGAFSDITSVDLASLKQDSQSEYAIPEGSGNGWYLYLGPPSHVISPIAGKVLVFRTHNGRYAKMEIKSYYQDAPDNPNGLTTPSQYYTFDYAYQSEEGITQF